MLMDGKVVSGVDISAGWLGMFGYDYFMYNVKAHCITLYPHTLCILLTYYSQRESHNGQLGCKI